MCQVRNSTFRLVVSRTAASRDKTLILNSNEMLLGFKRGEETRQNHSFESLKYKWERTHTRAKEQEWQHASPQPNTHSLIHHACAKGEECLGVTAFYDLRDKDKELRCRATLSSYRHRAVFRSSGKDKRPFTGKNDALHFLKQFSVGCRLARGIKVVRELPHCRRG